MTERAAPLPSLETLVALATEAVLQALEAQRQADGTDRPAGRTILWLLGAPAGHLGRLLPTLATLERLGHRQTVAAPLDVTRVVTPAPGIEVLTVEGAATTLLQRVAEADLVILGALGWAQAAALAALDDRDPFVAAVLDARTAGRPVAALAEPWASGILGAAPGLRAGPVRAAALAREGDARWRAMLALGITPRPLDALTASFTAAPGAGGVADPGLGGLLREQDVAAAAARGQQQLEVPRGTVVTPLARDRARDLGVTLVRPA
jgi:hypothetical protein